MNSISQKQTQQPRTTKRDPFASLRARGLIRDPTSAERDLSPPTIKPKGGSVADLVSELRG
jgi:hypothetical protein